VANGIGIRENWGEGCVGSCGFVHGGQGRVCCRHDPCQHEAVGSVPDHCFYRVFPLSKLNFSAEPLRERLYSAKISSASADEIFGLIS
jgi:hypothetical protein